MNPKVFLITPPFTQLNTPYPATAYLKGFFNTKNISSCQADLGLSVLLRLLSKEGLTQMFEHIIQANEPLDPNAQRMVQLRECYINTIDPVIQFLQNKNPNLAHAICTGNLLPEASRFEQLSDLDWAFGAMGIQDKAKHLATMYLEDLSDLIVATVDPHFGFSRYAERLSRCANTFDELYEELHANPSYIDSITFSILEDHSDVLSEVLLVAITAPFPGNVYSAFRCAQWIKKHYPKVKLCLGGGYPNTELRSLTDPRVFEFFDFITLDDGEAPLLSLLQHLEQALPEEFLKRTYVCNDGRVKYQNGSLIKDIAQNDLGTPDYSGLPLSDYISVIEIANPMHRMWSDGRWNKLTLAHGCYWGKCTFCDISLDYIKHYEASSAQLIVDRIEALIKSTGNIGFHFVDEAAPPALMREMALEILKRGLVVVWWANIRFEKSFTKDLCHLLAMSGCIAVSGGLEVASDRLLQLIQKGVTVTQVAKVADNFTEAGIMVHAYLMYGFPTQTAQETIDALEIVRQLFSNNILQSAYWHRFAMTTHSPVGMHPEDFGVIKTSEQIGSFANNDLDFIDPSGTNHEAFSEGLRKSLFNYMHGMCFDFPLQKWFDFKVPKTTIPPNYILKQLEQYKEFEPKPSSKIIWLGGNIQLQENKKTKSIVIFGHRSEDEIELSPSLADWTFTLLQNAHVRAPIVQTYGGLTIDFNQKGLGDFNFFWTSAEMMMIRSLGILIF